MQVSVLGFGGAEIGDAAVSTADVERLLNSAIDAGLNVIDTAECYGDSEEKIGRAVAHRRGEFHLFTKCGHASGFEEPDWDPGMLAKQIDRSLKRLLTDHVDLVQLHSCSKDLLQQGDVIDVLRRAKEAGKTRYIGYSGDRDAAVYAIESGAFDTLQTSINIADQQAIHLTLPLARDRGMGVIAKRPIANAAWRAEPEEDAYARTYWERLQRLQYPFTLGDAPEAVSITLRFTLAQPAVSTAIVGTAKPERWAQNARLLEAGPLPEEEIAAISDRWEEIADDWPGMG
jgi:aryl-alcohol dehydrogenase-like predicted oxidoreductase